MPARKPKPKPLPNPHLCDCPDLDGLLDLDRVWMALEASTGAKFPPVVVAGFIQRIRFGLNINEVRDADKARAAGGAG